MICFFNSDCNSIMKNFWKISLVDFYNDCLETVRNHTADFFLPCIQRLALPDDYIMYGTYERKHFKDVRLVKQPFSSSMEDSLCDMSFITSVSFLIRILRLKIIAWIILFQSRHSQNG